MQNNHLGEISPYLKQIMLDNWINNFITIVQEKLSLSGGGWQTLDHDNFIEKYIMCPQLTLEMQ